jgi:ArsR family transcriptional regulator
MAICDFATLSQKRTGIILRVSLATFYIDRCLYNCYTLTMTSTRPLDCCNAPLAVPTLPPGERRQLVDLFKALGDDTRLEVFRLIAGQDAPVCVCDIVDRFHVSQPTISHHLKVLRDAGLITVSRRGNWAFYAVDQEGVAKVMDGLGAMAVLRTVDSQ